MPPLMKKKKMLILREQNYPLQHMPRHLRAGGWQVSKGKMCLHKLTAVQPGQLDRSTDRIKQHWHLKREHGQPTTVQLLSTQELRM